MTELPLPASCAAGCCAAPTPIEVACIADVGREVFGPVLHVLRYRREAPDMLLAEHRTAAMVAAGRALPDRSSRRE